MAGIWLALCSCWTHHSHHAPMALGCQLLPYVRKHPTSTRERGCTRATIDLHPFRVSLSTAMAGLCKQAGSNEPNSCFIDFPAFTLYKLAWCKLKDVF